MVAKAKKKGSKVISVDFTGVESGGGGRLLPEGRYKFEIEDIEQKTGSDSGSDYLAFTTVVLEGEFEGTKAWDNFSLQPQALWKLRGLLETLEIEVPDGSMDIDPDDLIGMLVGGNVIHEDYNGKAKHRIDSYFPAADLDEEDTGSKKKPTATASASKKKTPAADPDESSDWTKGQKVSFKDGKKTLQGKITSINGDSIGVKTASGDEYEVDAADLEAA